MKKFRIIGVLLAACALFVARPAQAQFSGSYTFPLVAGDTLNNTDTVFKTITASTGYKDLGVQVELKKISGTVAGKLILWGSMDGINYVATDSMSYVVTTPSSLITPTFDNQAYVTKSGTPFYKYAILATSTGTVSAQVRVSYMLRRQQVTIAN